MILWDKRVVEKIENCVVVYTLAVKFRNIEDGSIWAFAEVYGPNYASDRRILLEELAGMMNWWTMPWCVEGDFRISTSIDFLAKDLVKRAFLLCQIFLSFFMSRA